MKTEIFQQNGQFVAVFEGRLDTAASAQTEKDIQPLLGVKGEDVILDCAKLSYISSSGLRIFLSILKNAKPKGSRVIIKNVNDEIRQVFDITGFSSLFVFQ